MNFINKKLIYLNLMFPWFNHPNNFILKFYSDLNHIQVQINRMLKNKIQVQIN